MKCKYYNRRFDTLLGYCKRLYELEGCSTGGPLHILLDDDNYNDDNIKFCLAQSLKHPDREVSKIGAHICREYLKMSMEERSVFDWYWCGSDLECEWSSCEVCPFIGNEVILSKGKIYFSNGDVEEITDYIIYSNENAVFYTRSGMYAYRFLRIPLIDCSQFIMDIPKPSFFKSILAMDNTSYDPDVAIEDNAEWVRVDIDRIELTEVN